jgi:hypothetical protein
MPNRGHQTRAHAFPNAYRHKPEPSTIRYACSLCGGVSTQGVCTRCSKAHMARQDLNSNSSDVPPSGLMAIRCPACDVLNDVYHRHVECYRCGSPLGET